MSHRQQRKFCKQVRRRFPAYFREVLVADVGSMDINGNNYSLFKNSMYYGIDLAEGENVDVVGPAHEVLPVILKDIYSSHNAVARIQRMIVEDDVKFNTIISTEALEHDKHLEQTLTTMYQSLHSGGLLVITAAGDGRAEHGTNNHRPQDSPCTTDYYKNVSNEMFAKILPAELFKVYHLEQNNENHDLKFFGIKK